MESERTSDRELLTTNYIVHKRVPISPRKHKIKVVKINSIDELLERLVPLSTNYDNHPILTIQEDGTIDFMEHFLQSRTRA